MPQIPAPPPGWRNLLLNENPGRTLLLAYRTTQGKDRPNYGAPLAIVTLHAIQVHGDHHVAHPPGTEPEYRPLLAMHMLCGQPGAEGHMVGCTKNPWVTSRDSLERMINQGMAAMGVERYAGRPGVSDTLSVPVRARDCLSRTKAIHVPETLMTVAMRRLEQTTTPRPARTTTPTPARRQPPCSTPTQSRLHSTRSQSAPIASRSRGAKRGAPD